MTLTESVDTQDVRSRMGTLPDSVAHDDKCTVRPPDPDLQIYKHMFTVDSEAHNNKEQLPSGYTIPQFPQGRYGMRSTFTAYRNGVSHLGTAVTGPPGHSWGPVQGDPTAVEEFYPIKNDPFKYVPIDEPGQWSLKVGPFEFGLKGRAYDPTQGWGMNVNEFARSEWENGRMSIVGVKVKEGHLDPRPRMTQDSLNTACAGSVASCPTANGTSVSEK